MSGRFALCFWGQGILDAARVLYLPGGNGRVFTGQQALCVVLCRATGVIGGLSRRAAY